MARKIVKDIQKKQTQAEKDTCKIIRDRKKDSSRGPDDGGGRETVVTMVQGREDKEKRCQGRGKDGQRQKNM